MPKRTARYSRKSRERPIQDYGKGIWNKIGKVDRFQGQGRVIKAGNPVADRGPVPTSFFTKLRYVEKKTLYPEAVTGILNGTEAEYILNSLYDPGSGGHQPYCFDQLAALYKKYIVYGVSIQLTCSNASNSNNAVTYLIRSANSSTTITGLNTFDCQERWNAGAIYCNTAGAQHTTADLGYISLPQVEGVTMSEYMGNHNNGSLVSNNPNYQIKMLIAASNMAAVTGQVVDVTVSMVFHCKFYERAFPTQS